MELLLLAITIVSPMGAWAAGAHWGYEGPHGTSHWASMFKDCGGKRQSPINIDTGSVKPKYLMPFSFKNYEVPAKTMKVANNGHSAKITMESKSNPVVRQGGLEDDYVFAQLHFHWGSDAAQGSEHTIDGVRYPLEMHLVHYKKSYGSLGGSVGHGDGLAVLGVMFEVGETDNAAFTPMFSSLANITDAGVEAELSNPYPLRAFLPDSTEKFFRYDGSLTTPTCNEAVIWTVFDTTVKISEKQLKALRAIESEVNESGERHKIVNNYRPPQPLNGRKVYVAGVGSSADSVSTKNMGLALLMSTLTVIMKSL